MTAATPALPSPERGFSLVEIVVAVALVGIVVAAALPSHQATLQRARRADAVAALHRLHLAQEQYRSRHGRYAADLAALGAGAARSPEGLYELAVAGAEAERVTLVARASTSAAQRSDRDCPELTLQLVQGLAEQGPNGRCWNR